MRALVYESFGSVPEVRNVETPRPDDDGVVIKVMASGICRSDWHGWMGNDPDISLPHVPGHELAGIIESVGKDIQLWKPGDRVTLPFVCGCGTCHECRTGNQQVCDAQFQPGFTHWGSFAQYVSIHYADINLVRIPDEMDFVTAASLGCRFITSFRGIVARGKVQPGSWVAVHGCGGVGLSAVMIAHAIGAQVVAVDIRDENLKLAREVGAVAVINSNNIDRVDEVVKELSGGGVHVSMDALGHPDTCFNSIASLRKRGKHIQVGIMEKGQHHVKVPVEKIIAGELEILGSHGMQAHEFKPMLDMINLGKLKPEKLVGKTISLEESAHALIHMNDFNNVGVTIINKFGDE